MSIRPIYTQTAPSQDWGNNPGTVPYQYQPGSSADVLKNVVYVATIRLMQKKYPEGIVLIDTHSGPGVYDEVPEEYFKGAARVIERNNDSDALAAPSVKKYVSLLNKLMTEFGEGTLPGSAIFARELMRDHDEHRLCDLFEQDCEGLYEDAQFKQLDCYAPETLDYLLPRNEDKHPVILIDPPYDEPQDWSRAKDFLERILVRKPDATVLMSMPFIRGDRNRWSFPNGLKALAKDKATVGRYFCSVVVAKEGLEGSAMLVTNPTNELDSVVDEPTLDWMAHVMNKGKADFSVEQAMKKKKKIIRSY